MNTPKCLNDQNTPSYPNVKCCQQKDCSCYFDSFWGANCNWLPLS